MNILKNVGALLFLGGMLLFPTLTGKWEKRKRKLKRKKFEAELDRKEVYFL